MILIYLLVQFLILILSPIFDFYYDIDSSKTPIEKQVVKIVALSFVWPIWGWVRFTKFYIRYQCERDNHLAKWRSEIRPYY